MERPKYSIYVADGSSNIIGAVFIKITDYKNGLIKHIPTDEKYRKHGISRGMLEYVMWKENLSFLSADTDAESVDFYAKTGFNAKPLGEKYPGIERFYCEMSK